MKTRAVARLGILATAVAVAGGCSLINAYDDVAPFKDAGTGPGEDAGGPLPDGATAEGGGDSGGSDGNVQDVVTPPDAGPPQGFVVVAGIEKNGDGGLNYVLSVLDAVDGGERSREHMNVVAVAYDPHGDQGGGADEVFYVFETPDAGNRPPGNFFVPIFTGPTTRTVLRVRKLDVHTGKWSDTGSAVVPPPRSNQQIVVLANRLAYLADGDAGARLVTLDTTNPAAVTGDASAGGVMLTDLTDGGAEIQIVDMAGTPDNAANPVGGTLTLLERASNSGSAQFQLRGLTVKSSSVLFKTPSPVGNSFDAGSNPNPGLGNFANNDVVALPGAINSMPVVKQVDRNTHTDSVVVTFSPSTDDLKPLTFSKCDNAAFVCERLSNGLSVVPFTTSSTGNKIDWGFHCSSEVFEPYSETVVLPFLSLAQFALRRVPVTKSATTVTLGNAQNFGPADLAPYQLAVRNPPTFACP